MELSEIIETVSERKQYIERKYNAMMDKISELESELVELENVYKYNTKEFISQKRNIIQTKISKIKSKANTWHESQLGQVENWLIEQENSIKLKLEKQLKDLNEKRMQFRTEKQSNNI